MESKKFTMSVQGTTCANETHLFDDDSFDYEMNHSEMTLRDYFAAEALSSIIIQAGTILTPDRIASIAYDFAQKMLEEKKRIEEGEGGEEL